MTIAFTSLLVILVLATLLGMPIGLAMIVSGTVYLVVAGQDLSMGAEQVLTGMTNNYIFLAVPMFILAANIMNASAMTDRLFEFAKLFVGRMKGGLAQVDVVVSIIFSSMSGSAIADAAGPGMMSLRAMEKAGYSRSYAAAVIAASATLSPIIPPSIPLILYAVVSSTSVGALFIGGIGPGLLMAVALIVTTAWIAHRRNFPAGEGVPRHLWLQTVVRSLLPLSMPMILLGGLYSGVFTPTEAAAVGAAYALFLAALVYRVLGFHGFYRILVDSSRTTASLSLVLAGSFLLNYVIVIEQVPLHLAALFERIEFSPLGFLLMVNVIFLVLGCFLETTIMILVIVPLLLPTMNMLGINPVYFGLVVTINMMIGLITPPYGILLFVLSNAGRINLWDIVRDVMPYIIALLACLMLIILFPEIVLWLPRLAGYAV